MYSTGHIDKKEVDLSKPTGEWTPDYVIEMTCRNNFSRVIADAHNAELSADRKERVTNLSSLAEGYRLEIQQLRSQLADAKVKEKS